MCALVGTTLLARWARRAARRQRPAGVAEQFTYYDAVVRSVNEGMLLVDQLGTVVSANAEARRLLAPESADGPMPSLEQVGLPQAVRLLLTSTGEVRDEVAVTEERVLLISRSPVHIAGISFGSVVTLRDHTELEVLTGQLRSSEDFTQALRAQAHESANRLHTVVSLVEMGEYQEAVNFAVAELALSQILADRLVEGVADPALAALLLGKSAQASQRGIDLVVQKGTYLPTVQGRSHEMVTILGNLIDNAMHALTDQRPGGERTIRVMGVFTPNAAGVGQVEIRVADSGPGLPPEQWSQVFAAGWTTKSRAGAAGPRGLGLALVGQAVRRLSGTIEGGPGPAGVGAMFTVRFTLRAGGPSRANGGAE